MIASEYLIKTVIDIESKDFIKRDESGGQRIYYNVNQPIIEKKATVARSISRDESSVDYSALSYTRWDNMQKRIAKIKDSADAIKEAAKNDVGSNGDSGLSPNKHKKAA